MENRKFSRLRRWAREGIIFFLLALAVMWGVDQYRKPTLPASFSAAPMHSIDGKLHDITALSQERPLLIYVWATWCSICRFTTPSVNTLAEQGGNVVSIAMRSGVTPTLVSVSKGKVVSTTTGWTSYWGMKLRLWWAGL